MSTPRPAQTLPLSFIKGIEMAESTLEIVPVIREESSTLDWLGKYIKENPISTSSALLTLFGLGAIYAYQFHIEYFPMFDLTALASVVFGAALVGLVLLTVLALLLFIPALQIGNMAFGENADGKGEMRLAQYIGVSILAFIIWVAYIWTAAEFSLPPWTVFIVFGLVFAGTLLAKMAFPGPAVQSQSGWRLTMVAMRKRWGEKKWDMLASTGAIAFVGFLQFLPINVFFILLRDSPAHQKEIDMGALFIQAAVASAIIQAASAFLVHAWFNPRATRALRPVALLVALVAPLLIPVVAGNPALLWMRVAQVTKLGSYHVNEMIVKRNVCGMLALNGPAYCVPAGAEYARICHVHVLSGLGTQTYLMLHKPPPQGRNGRVDRVLIPSADIVSQVINVDAKFNHIDSVERYLLKHPARCESDASTASPTKPAAPVASKTTPPVTANPTLPPRPTVPAPPTPVM